MRSTSTHSSPALAASRSFTTKSLLLLAAASAAFAGPYPKDDLHDSGYSYLMMRGCETYCGANNQFCCGPNEECATLNGNLATCIAPGQGGAFTTIWTVTRTYTSTGYTIWAPVPTPTAGVDCIPQNSEQEACGAICCAGWQTCAFKGQCSAKPGLTPPSTVVVTSDGVVTTQYSAPYRVTGVTVITTSGVVPTGTGTRSSTGTGTRSSTGTGTQSSTGTRSAATATASGDHVIGANPVGSHDGGLSPGAIAGIVLGTLAGVALLILLCFCCIARGLWNAIFGKKQEHRSTREEALEERYSKYGSSRIPSAYSRRERHSGWFGGDGATSSASGRAEKQRKTGAGLLGLGAAFATLLALFSLKKDKRPAPQKASSRYDDSYNSYSDWTSPELKFWHSDPDSDQSYQSQSGYEGNARHSGDAGYQSNAGHESNAGCESGAI